MIESGFPTPTGSPARDDDPHQPRDHRRVRHELGGNALRLPEVEIFWELAKLITIMLLGHWLEMRSIAQARG